MHTLKINVGDSMLDQVLAFLRQLPKEDVQIVEDVANSTEAPHDILAETSGLLKSRNVDPLLWQKEIRSQWDQGE